MSDATEGPVDHDVGRDDEWDVLAEYSRTDGRREWVSVGTWLLPGDAVVQISVAELDRLRAERDALLALLRECRPVVMTYSPSGQPFDFPRELVDRIDAALPPNAEVSGGGTPSA